MDNPRCMRVFDLADTYRAMDVDVATGDNPGVPCVDDSWQLLAARGAKGRKGEPGKPGQRGHKGDRGPAGAKIEELRLSREQFVGPAACACATCSRNSSIKRASRRVGWPMLAGSLRRRSDDRCDKSTLKD
jgi:hypothetical protein